MKEIWESLNIQGCKVQLYLNVFLKTLQPLRIVSIIACPILRLRVHALMRTLVHASVCACVGALSFCLPLFCRYGNAINHSFMTKPRIRTEVEKKTIAKETRPKNLDQTSWGLQTTKQPPTKPYMTKPLSTKPRIQTGEKTIAKQPQLNLRQPNHYQDGENLGLRNLGSTFMVLSLYLGNKFDTEQI